MAPLRSVVDYGEGEAVKRCDVHLPFASNRFKMARVMSDVSEWALAQYLGLQIKDVRDWESARKVPTEEQVEQAAKMFGWSPDFFYAPDARPIDPDSIRWCKSSFGGKG